jgi:hypothetical protein
MPTAPEPAAATDTPSHFVVELERGHYVICQRVMTLTPEDPMQRLIEAYLANPLKAAPLPGWSGGKCGDPCDPDAPQMMLYRPQTGAFSGQTGRLVININAPDLSGNDSSGSSDPHG